MVPHWPARERLVIEQVVTEAGSHCFECDEGAGRDASKRDVAREVARWALVISSEGLRVVVGGAPDPDLVLLADARTAAAIASGTLNAQQALSAGTLRVCGDLTRLITLHDALAALGDFSASVRNTTEVPGL